MVFRTKSAEQTEALGQKLGASLPAGSVVAFTIVNEYRGNIPLFHFDMYRLESSDALFDIGWEDYLERGGVCAVEWSENVADAMPEGTVYVTIERAPEGENARIITITGGRAL